MMDKRYPLVWPPGKPRTLPYERTYSQFGFGKTITAERAMREMLDEVLRIGAQEIIVSTNIELRADGLPRMSQRHLADDPGVAVYFKRKGKPMVLACDKWATVHENVWAIRKTIEAIRGIERWGSKEMMEAAFTGFTALPAPEQPWQVLGIRHDATHQEIDQAYRRLASTYHPDRHDGDAEMMARINRARTQMLDGTP